MLFILAEIGTNYCEACTYVLDHVKDENVRDDCPHTDLNEELFAPANSYLSLDVPMK